ncbi:MAG: ArnT family glycosyltransferase [Chthoniobacterales bacterium]
MPDATSTFALHETLLGPEALPPPPVRHALFACLVVLAAILHLCTAGWSEIHNGFEGEYAAGARKMLTAESPLLPIRGDVVAPQEPPLLYWSLLGSYKAFGVTAVAARLPMALAMITLVALTFLIGERLSGYWRGFVAGLIQLCSCGGFLWGRMVTPEPLFAVFTAAAILCAIGGYQDRRKRRWWFLGFATSAALAYLAEGIFAVAYLGGVILSLALFCREARIRFPRLLHWSCVLVFAALILPWHLWLQRNGGATWLLSEGRYLNSAAADGVRLFPFIGGHVVWFCPMLLLLLPGLLFASRRLFRPSEFGFAEAVPLCWMAIGFLPLLFLRDRQHFDSLPMWSAFALWAACAWDRTPSRLRLAGIGLAAIACIAGTLAIGSGVARSWIIEAPDAAPFHTVLLAAAVTATLAAFAGGAYLLWRGRETIATAVLLLGILPLDLALAETDAQLGPQFSFGSIAGFLQSRLGEDGEVIYEGTPRSGSSFGFYLDGHFSVVEPRTSGHRALSEADALERFGTPHPVYLIVQKDRVPFWQERLTERYHIYHQVSTCSSYVVVNNQP